MSALEQGRMVARAIEVDLDPDQLWAEIRPHRARGLLLSVGANPLWLGRRKVWSTSYKHGLDVIALAEHLGYQVTTNAPLSTTVESSREEEVRNALRSSGAEAVGDEALW